MNKQSPLPQACYLDNRTGGQGEALLLEARIKTLEQAGKEAMSPHDLKNGYSPAGLIRLLKGQIAYLKDESPETMHSKANIATGHNLERSRLERKGFEIQLPMAGRADRLSSLNELRLHLEYFGNIHAQTQAEGSTTWRDGLGRTWALYLLRDELLRLEALLKDKTKKTKGPIMDQGKIIKDPGGDNSNPAALLFEQTNDIRQAINTLKSEQRETRKAYKKAIATLDRGLEEIYQSFEDKQMLLFDEMPALSEEVEALIEHPSVTLSRGDLPVLPE